MRTVTNISRDEQPFRIRAYGLQELAMLYFPNSAPRSASAQLKRWIMRNPRGRVLPRAADTYAEAGEGGGGRTGCAILIHRLNQFFLLT